MEDAQYSVSWNEYQQSICKGLSSLQQRGQFVDMTLAADGHHVKVHQMVMSLVSPYIRDLISSAACPHPVIFLNKISYQTLQSILQYAYTGEVVVSNERINEFLNACKDLHIRGMENAMSPAVSYTVGNMLEKEVNTQHTNFEKYTTVTTENTMDDDSDNIHDDTSNPLSDSEQVETRTAPAAPVHRKPTDISAATLQYTVSNVGTVQVALNRYIYNLRNTRKNGEKLWRCRDFASLRCRAHIRVKDNVVVARAGAHIHPFHDAAILKRIQHGNMFTTMNEIQTAIDTKQAESKPAPKRITEHKRALDAFLSKPKEIS